MRLPLGPLAQLVERYTGCVEVKSSILLRSTRGFAILRQVLEFVDIKCKLWNKLVKYSEYLESGQDGNATHC